MLSLLNPNSPPSLSPSSLSLTGSILLIWNCNLVLTSCYPHCCLHYSCSSRDWHAFSLFLKQARNYNTNKTKSSINPNSQGMWRKTTHLGIIHKIHHWLIQCPIIWSKLVPPPPRQSHTHNQQFCLINTRTQYRGGSFLPRTVRDWNHLPSETVEAATADAFVSRASAQ